MMPSETIEQTPKPRTTQIPLKKPILVLQLPVSPPAVSKTSDQPKDDTTQVNRTVQIPLTGAPWALLQIPYPMTEENWEEMQSFLELMKRPLTQPKQS